ncbi:MAG: hypothetical protein U0237_14280 [Thermoleophilia bacterium]
MTAAGWLDPLRAALDAAAEPVTWFVRDDDGGWADDRLDALLDLADRHGVPVDVAMIPVATGPELARRLRGRIAGSRVRVHQHGYRHVNHEPEGRRCEFGPARGPEDIASDVRHGREVLLDRFGGDLDAVFTPPWNRSVPALAPALVACGIRVLSRDLSAGRLDHPGLAEVPVSVDWFGGRRGVRWTRAELGRRMADAVGAGGPVGLMLHHAVTPPGELADLDAVFALLAGHPAVRTRTIAQVAAAG